MSLQELIRDFVFPNITESQEKFHLFPDAIPYWGLKHYLDRNTKLSPTHLWHVALLTSYNFLPLCGLYFLTN